jgi:acyl-coenzyme A thioesterase PaaI-like protein
VNGLRAHFWDLPVEPPNEVWRERRRLAAALRELIALCVTTEADEAALASAADATCAAVDRLAPFPRKRFIDAFVADPGSDKMEFADRGTLVGPSNPIAPPLVLRDDGETPIAEVTFGPAYEGAPGCVHGGFIAAAFDQLFGYVQVTRNAGSLTATLSVKYRRPTPIDVPLRIEGRLDRVDGRKSWVSARMFARGEVTAEAEGFFVALAGGQMQTIVDRHTANDAASGSKG